ncbi:GWxTD domain-containing protein [candidate division KSB1 bacterium]|nr:GWxTD domain-containing protein [candidate division KSB1 bacterium]
MNRKSLVIIMFLLVLFNVQSSLDPCLAQEAILFGPPGFVHSYYFLRSEDDTPGLELGVYVEFCNDMLQFVKNSDDSFEANYDLSITILTEDDHVAAGSMISHKIVVPTYPKTKERSLTNFISRFFKLDFDDYRLIIELTDTETGKKLRREEAMRFADLSSAQLYTNDFIYLDSLPDDMSTVELDSIRPNLLKMIQEQNTDFGAMIEIYPKSTLDSLTIRYDVSDMADSVLFYQEIKRIPEGSRILLTIPLSDMITYAGKYRIGLSIVQNGSEYTKESRFTVNWTYWDLDEMRYHKRLLAPLMSYIPEKELKLLDYKSQEELEQWFYQYWRDRDPTPDTEKNELMYEFYRRVNVINFHFSVSDIDKSSWDTDRGRVYLKYGPPQNLERHMSDLNRPPFEIWHYPDIDRRFIFEDRRGKGDYELIKIE